MAKKKFTEGENPALQFISKPKEEPTPQSTITDITDVPKGFKLVPETKTKRVNLIMKPSLHEKAVEKSKSIGISFNEFINKMLEDYLELDESFQTSVGDVIKKSEKTK